MSLPAVLARQGLGLELRLQGPPLGDLFVAADPQADDGEQLLRALALGPLSGRPAIVRLAQTLADWREPDAWLARACAFLLLELDASRTAIDPEAGALTPPSVHLAPRGGSNANDGDRPVSGNAFHADPYGLLAALAGISGSPLDHEACFEFKALIEALPADAEIFAAGAMLSRENAQAPRIAIRRLGTGDIKSFLKTIGRESAAGALGRVAKVLDAAGPELCVALDLGAHKSDVVELEAYAGRDWSGGDLAGWSVLLNRLVRKDFADRQRAHAVLELVHPVGAEVPTSGLSHITITVVGKGLAPAKVRLGCVTTHTPQRRQGG